MADRNTPPGSSDEKPRYEAPVLLPLGEMAKGHGAFCSTGGNVGVSSSENCAEGGNAAGNCLTGRTAARNCNIGTSAS